MEDKKHSGNPVDNLAGSAWEYLSMKIDEAKLKGVEGLSVFIGRVMAMVGAVIFMSLAFLFAGFAVAYELGDLVGSTALGFVIVGAVFLGLALLFFALRKKIFVNSLVTFFVKLFFKSSSI